MAGMYRAVPLDDAMRRIRKAGYRYVSMAAKHGDDVVYSPELPKPERVRMLRRVWDLGVEPFLSLGGFSGDPQTEAGLQKYIAQLDLCADYEISTMVGAGPWYYTKFPNIPKRERDWQEEVSSLRGRAGPARSVVHIETGSAYTRFVSGAGRNLLESGAGSTPGPATRIGKRTALRCAS